MTVWGS